MSGTPNDLIPNWAERLTRMPNLISFTATFNGKHWMVSISINWRGEPASWVETGYHLDEIVSNLIKKAS